MGSHFPNSARAQWERAQSAPHSTPKQLERERRLMAEILAEDLLAAHLDQLHQVATIVGRTPRWKELVAAEARNPGMVGLSVLRRAER